MLLSYNLTTYFLFIFNYSKHTILCWFQVYNILIQHFCTLQSDPHSSSGTHLESHGVIRIPLTLFPMLYIPNLWLIVSLDSLSALFSTPFASWPFISSFNLQKYVLLFLPFCFAPFSPSGNSILQTLTLFFLCFMTLRIFHRFHHFLMFPFLFSSRKGLWPNLWPISLYSRCTHSGILPGSLVVGVSSCSLISTVIFHTQNFKLVLFPAPWFQKLPLPMCENIY